MSAGLSRLLPRRPSPLSLSFFFFSLTSGGPSVGASCWFWRAAAAQPMTQQTLWHMLRRWKETRLLCRKHVAALLFSVGAQTNSTEGFNKPQPLLSDELNKR